jgi:hypothetical protein
VPLDSTFKSSFIIRNVEKPFYVAFSSNNVGRHTKNSQNKQFYPSDSHSVLHYLSLQIIPHQTMTRENISILEKKTITNY